MAGVDVDTLTMEQYLALSRENQAPDVVKPEIRGNVNFEIKSQFMCELREDTFSGNKDEDAHDHIDRVLNIVGLFNILEVSKDAVMLRVFPFTLIGSVKRTRLEESLMECVHAIQLDCQNREGPHLNKDCPINEEIKQVEEEAKLRRTIGLSIKRNLLGEVLKWRKEKYEQAKVVIVEHEGPSSPKKIKNLHGISFLSDSQEENTNDQLFTKESNLRHFMLPCTIGNFHFYAIADLGASVNVLPRNIFEYLELTNLSETEMLVEMVLLEGQADVSGEYLITSRFNTFYMICEEFFTITLPLRPAISCSEFSGRGASGIPSYLIRNPRSFCAKGLGENV
ncbi:zinc knuckle CX2CX4HX4C containing protein [Tanacetum coccineum]|uniref:Zinc knuckle CX2CX4HX4C containing protein n=1 Tax=Tanacetum coccineum TaxID=301880 RepID=A0ABQ4YNN8_9ASTR